MGNTRSVKAISRDKAVHPRWCGEHFKSDKQFTRFGGSSPLVWGTRIINMQSTQGTAVHPRWCGEHLMSTTVSGTGGGSSPLVWGTHPINPKDPLSNRFIPAGVGNTDSAIAASPLSTVHPRWCGEHYPASFSC